jgi:Spy/CpxP family protein refolding chaperone
MVTAGQDRARWKRLLMRTALAFAVVILLSVPSRAQRHDHGGMGGGGFGGMGGGPMADGGMGGGVGLRMRDSGGDLTRSLPSRPRLTLQVGPPGRWWDDKHYVKQLKLSSDQQRRMDSIFEQSRPVLVKRFESLEIEEQKMDALTHAKSIDESALFAQIDRVAQARADLEKASTHYLYQLREELDGNQLAKLDEQH